MIVITRDNCTSKGMIKMTSSSSLAFRFSTRHKANVKDGLDVDAMVIYLCSEITSGYHYLFQLATPQLDSQDIVSNSVTMT